jgi:hypothetical protein
MAFSKSSHQQRQCRTYAFFRAQSLSNFIPSRSAGVWLFRGRRWLDPTDPHDAVVLAANHARLCALFPAVAAPSGLTAFLSAVEDVSRRWAILCAGPSKPPSQASRILTIGNGGGVISLGQQRPIQCGSLGYPGLVGVDRVRTLKARALAASDGLAAAPAPPGSVDASGGQWGPVPGDSATYQPESGSPAWPCSDSDDSDWDRLEAGYLAGGGSGFLLAGGSDSWDVDLDVPPPLLPPPLLPWPVAAELEAADLRRGGSEWVGC